MKVVGLFSRREKEYLIDLLDDIISHSRSDTGDTVSEVEFLSFRLAEKRRLKVEEITREVLLLCQKLNQIEKDAVETSEVIELSRHGDSVVAIRFEFNAERLKRLRQGLLDETDQGEFDSQLFYLSRKYLWQESGAGKIVKLKVAAGPIRYALDNFADKKSFDPIGYAKAKSRNKSDVKVLAQYARKRIGNFRKSATKKFKGLGNFSFIPESEDGKYKIGRGIEVIRKEFGG